MLIPFWLVASVLLLFIIGIVVLAIIFERQYAEIEAARARWEANYNSLYFQLLEAKRNVKDIKQGLEDLCVDYSRPAQRRNPVKVLNDVSLRSTRRIVGSPKNVPYDYRNLREYRYSGY